MQCGHSFHRPKVSAAPFALSLTATASLQCTLLLSAATAFVQRSSFFRNARCLSRRLNRDLFVLLSSAVKLTMEDIIIEEWPTFLSPPPEFDDANKYNLEPYLLPFFISDLLNSVFHIHRDRRYDRPHHQPPIYWVPLYVGDDVRKVSLIEGYGRGITLPRLQYYARCVCESDRALWNVDGWLREALIGRDSWLTDAAQDRLRTHEIASTVYPPVRNLIAPNSQTQQYIPSGLLLLFFLILEAGGMPIEHLANMQLDPWLPVPADEPPFIFDYYVGQFNILHPEILQVLTEVVRYVHAVYRSPFFLRIYANRYGVLRHQISDPDTLFDFAEVAHHVRNRRDNITFAKEDRHFFEVLKRWMSATSKEGIQPYARHYVVDNLKSGLCLLNVIKVLASAQELLQEDL